MVELAPEQEAAIERTIQIADLVNFTKDDTEAKVTSVERDVVDLELERRTANGKLESKRIKLDATNIHDSLTSMASSREDQRDAHFHRTYNILILAAHSLVKSEAVPTPRLYEKLFPPNKRR